jgi:hypothetical protein
LTVAIEDPQERARQEVPWTLQAKNDLAKFTQVAQYRDNRPQRQIAAINALFTLYTALLAESVQAESFFVSHHFSTKPDIVTWFFSTPEVLSIFVGLCASEVAIRLLTAPVLVEKTDKAYKATVAQRNLEWWTGQSNQYRFIVKNRMAMSSGSDTMVFSVTTR